MGHPDRFAKLTFAEETARVTGGAVAWRDPPEIGLVKVQGDGLLLVQNPALVAALAMPWSASSNHDEVLIEIKMAGDHLDFGSFQRALLRRQARQVQRAEDPKNSFASEEPLWIIAPHLPTWINERRSVRSLGDGCYAIEPSPFVLLWIAANELPLADELVPFLIARSGRALDEFARWVVDRRPLPWLLDMLKYTAMREYTREELMRKFAPDPDPEVEARQIHMARMLVDMRPELRHEFQLEGELSATRTALRRVLERRNFELGPEQKARIESCSELRTLERWLDQAVTAANVGEALE